MARPSGDARLWRRWAPMGVMILAAALAGHVRAADPRGGLLRRFPKADLNGDGKLTAEELRAWAVKAYPKADIDGDGKLSNAELRALGRQLAGVGRLTGGTAARQTVGDPWAHIPPEALKSSAPSMRDYSPIVLTGRGASALKGAAPASVVAYRRPDGDAAWEAVPVQVDERAVREVYDIYNRFRGARGARGGGGVYPLRGPSFRTLVYTDPDTFTGGDDDPKIDDDDEIVFLYKDAGVKASGFAEPPGVVKGSGLEVELTDPLAGAGAAPRYVYLFRAPSARPAPRKYVQYDFKLLAGPYKKTWDVGRPKAGPFDLRPRDPAGYKNREDSTVRTKYYTRHFSGKAITDSLTLAPPGGTGVNILDMRKALFAPGVPGRSVLTFTQGEGAFICNINGPVRAIRSAIGANSGPLTQFDAIFYERREDLVTHLRVHPISSVVNFTDYSPAAAGMTYRNSLNPDGVLVDGRPDKIKPGPIVWEMLHGKPGSLARLHRLVTSVPLSVTSYYNDNRDTPIPQCSGDRHAYAASGPWIVGGIPNTDPRRSGAATVTAYQYCFYALDNPTPDTARRLLAETARPIAVKIRPIR